MLLLPFFIHRFVISSSLKVCLRHPDSGADRFSRVSPHQVLFGILKLS